MLYSGLTRPVECLQTKTVNTPIGPARTSAKVNARLADAAVVQSEAQPDSNAEANADASSVVSKTDEPARASSVTADHEPEASGAQGSATASDPPQSCSRVQVSLLISIGPFFWKNGIIQFILQTPHVIHPPSLLSE